MKKFIVAILAFLYLGSSAGATVHLHYCMGKLVERSLWHDRSGECGKCGMEKKDTDQNGCCKDEHKNVKLQTDHKAVNPFSEIKFDQPAASFSHLEIPGAELPSVTEENPVSNAPPRSNGIAVYIRNRVFRI